MNSYRIITSIDAREDFRQIIAEYKTQNETTAKRFRDEFRATRESLQTNPQRFQEVFLFVRRAFIARFPYNIYYVVSEATLEVEIIAVFHQKRDERMLRQRINFE